MNSQHGDELGSGQEASHVSCSSLAEDSRLRGILQDLPQVIQEGLCQGLSQMTHKIQCIQDSIILCIHMFVKASSSTILKLIFSDLAQWMNLKTLAWCFSV